MTSINRSVLRADKIIYIYNIYKYNIYKYNIYIYIYII